MLIPDRKATIYDIARLSGASPSTVSAALNGTWKSRRISQAKVDLIQKVAAEQGYSINMQARGLRQARSGLVGMMIPGHDNRFFTTMSQVFEQQARERGLVPVIASTLRDPNEERRIIESLISYAIDFVFVAGATDPDAISALCAAAKLRHIFVDLPGSGAPSVVSDNYRGATELTRLLLTQMEPAGTGPRALPYFIGGGATHSSRARIRAFTDQTTAAGLLRDPGQIITCGYGAPEAYDQIARLCDRLGGLPAALFVNSLTTFEGVLGHFVHLAPEAFAHSVIGCYDYDPFASYLQFPVHMVRQNARALITRAYALIEAERTDPVLIQIEPELVPPRTIYKDTFTSFG